MADLPEQLSFKHGDIANRNIPGSKLYAKLLVELEHLVNLFFIERLLNKMQNVTLSAHLVQISLKIVSATLIFWTHKERMLGLHEDFEWLVVGFASPAAGILCLEIMRPYTDNLNCDLVDSGISRSELIQNMSLLNGFLSWIEPLMPGRKMTASFVQGVVQRVLDQALNPPVGSHDGLGLETMEWATNPGADLNDLSFNLLDTFEWLRPE